MDETNPKIEELLASFLDELIAGADASEVRNRLVNEHPDLQPELARRLEFAETLFNLTMPRSDDVTKSLGDSSSTPTRIYEPDERIQRISCPHCGSRLNLVDSARKEITCGNCGSIVTVGGTEQTTSAFRPTPTRIGRFRILSFLGSGGFGTAYLAHDPTLDRNVAIKVPRAGEFATRNERERFIREAKNAAGLRHENIVQVFEINSDGEYPYIVSEYIDGMTLAERVTGLPIAYDEIARLMIIIAEAVHYAHERGIIHRDLKPGNVFLNSSHKPYVADFGLARNLAAEHTMTMEGELLGTPAYMSPEQASGSIAQITARSDVYSLGVILYRMLCGENPFRANGRMLIHQVIHDEPIAPRRINERIPADLETITLKAMQKHPGDRYASAKELAEDLRRWKNDQAILARPESGISKMRRWCRKNSWVASLLTLIAGLLILLSIISVSWAFREQQLKREAVGLQELAEEKADESQIRLAAADTQNGLRQMELDNYAQSMLWFAKALKDCSVNAVAQRIRSGMLWKNYPRLNLARATGSHVRALRFSPKGEYLLAGTLKGELIRISSTSVEEAPLVLKQSSAINAIKISPDESVVLIACKDSSSATLRRLTNGENIAELRHDKPISSVDISPDSRWAATADTVGNVKVWSLPGGALQFEFAQGQPRSTQLTFVADDRLLTYAFARGTEDQTNLVCWKISEQGSQNLYEIASNLHSVDVDTSVKALMINQRDGSTRLHDLEDGRSRATTLLNHSLVQANYVLADRQGYVTVLADGTLQSWTLDGQRSQSIRHPVKILDSSVDPRKRFLAIAGADGLVTIYWLHLLQRIGTQLAADESITAVAFHPDGRRLAAGGSPGTIRIWDLAGLAPDWSLMVHDGPVKAARFSSTGDKIVSVGEDRTARLWNTSNTQPIGAPIRFPGAVSDASFNKSGSLVAVASRDGKLRIVQANSGLPAGAEMKLDSGIVKLQFSPTDPSMLIAGCADGTLARIDAPNATVVYKTMQNKNAITELQFSPDGKQLIVASFDKTVSLRDPVDGKVLSPPVTHEDVATRCGFSVDSRTAWSCCTDGILRRWSTSSPWEVRERAFSSWPTCVAYTSSGNYVTTTYVGEVALWKEDKPLWQSSFREYQFTHCQCDPSEELVLVCGESSIGTGIEQERGIAILLDMATGQAVAPPLPHFESVARAFFDKSGKRLVTSSRDHSIRLWDIEQDNRSVSEISTEAIILSGSEITNASQVLPVEPKRIEELFKAAYQTAPQRYRCQADEIERWESYAEWVVRQKVN